MASRSPSSAALVLASPKEHPELELLLCVSCQGGLLVFAQRGEAGDFVELFLCRLVSFVHRQLEVPRRPLVVRLQCRPHVGVHPESPADVGVCLATDGNVLRLRGALPPCNSLCRVFGGASAVKVAVARVDLRVLVAALGSQQAPAEGLGLVLAHPRAAGVHGPEHELGVRVAALCGGTVPAGCLDVINRRALAEAELVAEGDLRGGATGFRGAPAPAEGLCLVLVHPVPLGVHGCGHGLGLDVARGSEGLAAPVCGEPHPVRSSRLVLADVLPHIMPAREQDPADAALPHRLVLARPLGRFPVPLERLVRVRRDKVCRGAHRSHSEIER